MIWLWAWIGLNVLVGVYLIGYCVGYEASRDEDRRISEMRQAMAEARHGAQYDRCARCTRAIAPPGDPEEAILRRLKAGGER